MGSLSTMFQAEVMAILMRTALPLFKNVRKGCNICSDNKAAIAKNCKTTSESALGEYERVRKPKQI
jgi:hypothetical protein